MLDEKLLDKFNIPRSMLPEVMDCAADFGVTKEDIIGRVIPIQGVAGDQQAALLAKRALKKAWPRAPTVPVVL